MPKSIPSTGDTNWGEVLNAHLAQVMNPATGGINTNAGNVTGLTSEDEGYTFLDTNTGQIKRFKGSGDGTNDTDWDITGGGIASSSTAPSNPTAGDTYFNTTDGKMYYWNGAAWVEVGKVYNLTSVNNTIKACITAISDWNNYVEGGFYQGDNLANACPGIGSTWRYCIVQRHVNSADYVQQIMSDFAGSGIYVRIKSSGAWKTWRKLGGTAPTATAPNSPNPGDTYYNTTDNKMYYWNETVWVEF